jgi:hypothetical protein
MTKNINFDADSDDTEGHFRAFEPAPSIRAYEAAPSIRVVADEVPTTVEQDEDDTQGHMRAPGFSGALSTDPKTQS